MAACTDQELLLGGLVDGELDAANIALIEAHVARCKDCRQELERLRALRARLRSEGVRERAPEGLHQRIRQMAKAAPGKDERRHRLPSWLAPGVGGALAASLAIVAVTGSVQHQMTMDQEIISGHVRSLQPGHLIDVATSNRHVVKPWFNGRIDFSPPVPELADKGFPLAGGRLDSLNGATVPAIVYKRRLHTVNLFIWPAKKGGERAFTKEGFSVIEWTRNDLRFAAVSDIPMDELRQFKILYDSRSG